MNNPTPQENPQNPARPSQNYGQSNQPNPGNRDQASRPANNTYGADKPKDPNAPKKSWQEDADACSSEGGSCGTTEKSGKTNAA